MMPWFQPTPDTDAGQSMTENVVKFPTNDKTPEEILKHALEMGLTDVIVIGYQPCGCEYRDTTLKDGPTALWLLERARHDLMHYDEGE